MTPDPSIRTRMFRNRFGTSQALHVMLAALIASLVSAHTTAQSADSAEWRMYNGDYSGTRFSTLQQITPENVESLAEVARYELPEVTSFQSGPLVIGDAIFV